MAFSPIHPRVERRIGDVVHPTVDHSEMNHIAHVIVVCGHVYRLARRSNGRVDLVIGRETISERYVGTLLNVDEAGVRGPDGGLAYDIVRQPVDLCVRSGDYDVPGPVVVAGILSHTVGDGGGNAVAQN